MPQFLISEPAEMILDSLGQALDFVDVGIILLNRDLRARFINRSQIELFGLPPALLASGPHYRDLLDHAGAAGWFDVAPDQLPDYLNQREAAVRAGSISPTQIDLRNGGRLLFSCFACPDGGRILTYADISLELQREISDAVERVSAELRFQTETLEDQAANLASLAEAADASARQIEIARLDLEQKIVEHRQLEIELRRLANTDGLTGMLNRTAFLTFAQECLEHGQHLAMLMLDIDHFKSINDRFGHAAGDFALQRLTATLRAETRECDLLGRLGGEEFAVLIPAVSPLDGMAVAERLRQRIAEAGVVFGDRSFELTVSIGVAVQQPGDRQIDGIMARADAALYRAKSTGRNRVINHNSMAA